MILPSTLAIVSCYKEKRQEYIGLIEICSGLGAICGPLFGATFYLLFGYMGPFECIGGIYCLFILYFLKIKSSIKFS